MSTPNEKAREFAEFQERVKRTVFLDNLSPQATSAVLETAFGQFGTVKRVEFIPNYTIPYPIPQSALVEMENDEQANAVIRTITDFPFMVSGMPRPVRARAATAEMFVDRPPPPKRNILDEVRWVDPSDPDAAVAKKMKQLCRKHTAETLALIKLTIDEEEKLAKKQEEVLNANFKKFELIDNVMQDGSASRLARAYGLNLALDD